jgi:hypothetical protein
MRIVVRALGLVMAECQHRKILNGGSISSLAFFNVDYLLFSTMKSS